MKTNKKIDTVPPLTPEILRGDELMPAEFAGMYQSGFEAGYKSGREAGYQQGFNDGHSSNREFAGQTAAIDKTLDDVPKAHVAVTPLPVEGQPAPKHGPLDPDTRKRVPGPPRRMLLGMPCKQCRVYLMSDEKHCPCCKQKAA